ncbi:MAG: lipid II flippase MurJ [Bacteroidota bacterium]
MLIRFYNYIVTDTARAYQALQVFRLGSVLVFSIIMVQFGLKSEEIGDFEWFIFLANVSSFFWGLGLKNAFMSYYPKLGQNDQRKLLFNLGGVLFILGCLAFGVLQLFRFPRLDTLYAYLPWLFCFIVLGTTASLSEHILLVKQRSKTLFYYGFISYSIYLFGLTFLVYQYRAIQPLFVGLAIWATLRFAYFVWLSEKESSMVLDYKLTFKFVLFGLPLILHVLMGAGMEYVDGYLVNAYFERSEFTYFRYGARELPVNTIFISALASAFIPLAVTNLNDSLAVLKMRLNRLMNFLFPMSIVLMIASPYIFRLVYSEEYLVSAQIFNIYLLILCSRILLPQVVIYARHKNSVLMVVSFLEFAINIGLSLFLMQFYGLYGIAFATVIAFLIQKMILIAYNKVKLGISLSSYINISKYFLYTLALYLTFCLSTFFL